MASTILSDTARADAAPRAWGVAALLLAASDALQSRLGAVSVHGEISGFSRAASGHCYFNLKDGDGQAAMLRCAMFRRAAGLLDFRPTDGQRVEVRGRVTVYEARGELQCVVEAMLPLGAGTLYELFLRLKAKLEAQGLFDPARKRALPRYPSAIGVVTSLQAAALHDIVTALARRSPQVPVVIYPSAVQGADAPAQLVAAIALANARVEVDVLLVCRGGGSIEDLWAFNDEQVVRAVAASAIPVVCGVGHETDFTLAEMAADHRAPTPTAAAEIAVPVAVDEFERLRVIDRRVRQGLHRQLDRCAQRLDLLVLQFGRPARWLQPQVERMQRLGARIDMALLREGARRRHAWAAWQHRTVSAARAEAQRQSARLDGLAARLAAVDPRRVLARGYVWVSDAEGRPVSSGAGLHGGERVDAHWADARASMQVLEVRPEHAAGHDG